MLEPIVVALAVAVTGTFGLILAAARTASRADDRFDAPEFALRPAPIRVDGPDRDRPAGQHHRH